jgi:hypothetical protein
VRCGRGWGVFVRRAGSETAQEGSWCDVRGERRVLGRVLLRRADGVVMAKGVAALDDAVPRPASRLRLTDDPLERGAVLLPEWQPW